MYSLHHMERTKCVIYQINSSVGPLVFFWTEHLPLASNAETHPWKNCKSGQGREVASPQTLPSLANGFYPVPKGQGYQYVLTLMRTFSKWLEAFPLPNASATSVAKVSPEQIFPTWGIPSTISRDRGSCFFGKITQKIGKTTR